MNTMHGRRRDHDEQHETPDRWLITYADMVTLLMVLFLVLYAMSQVDQKKFDSLRSGLATGFGHSDSVLDSSTSIVAEPGVSVAQPISPQEIVDAGSKLDQKALYEAVTKSDRLRTQRKYADAAAEATRLREIQGAIIEALRENNLENDVQTTIDDRGLTVSLISRHVVFEPNVASLTARGRLVVDTIAPVLRKFPDALAIDGHTNQVKVKPKLYPTDWELSSARAVSVLRHLNEQDGVPNSRLSAVGYGSTKPLVDPRRAGSQRVNKRVDIVILPRLPDQARQMLEQAAREQAAQRKEAS